jgi:hypothetical protein
MDNNALLTNAAIKKEEQNIQDAISENELIFVGKVIDVGDVPAYWSGYFPAYQSVRYQVEEVLKGQFAEKEITIDHAVVQYSQTAAQGPLPRLSPNFFAKDSRIIVFAMKATDGSWKNLHQKWGVRPFSQKSRDSIRLWSEV